MKYEDCAEFRTRTCQAWSVELPDGTRKLLLLDKDFTFGEVHDYCLTHYQKFKLSQITVGEVTFEVKKGDTIYQSDSRSFDETLELVPLLSRYP